MIENNTVFYTDSFGVPQPFDERESAWLRFFRWLVESGRLHDELGSEPEESSPQTKELAA